jgi:hypothetical protein
VGEAAFIASGSKCRTTAPTHGRTNQRCRDTSKKPVRFAAVDDTLIASSRMRGWAGAPGDRRELGSGSPSR